MRQEKTKMDDGVSGVLAGFLGVLLTLLVLVVILAIDFLWREGR